MDEVTERPCPQCGASQPPGAAGVCPACALRGVLREEVPAHGRAVGRYQPIELLGEGGMGAVWLAEDPALDRLVAVKMLPLASFRRKAMEARLRREARAVASLNHPHVVKVFEVGEDRETLYLAMEYVEGGDLRDGLREGRWEPRRAARFLLQAADAVAHAHAAGVLHRDLKPGNVLLTETGQPRLADFGLAAPVGARGDLTLTGQALGTPAYMAPEVAEGRPVDVRVDVYGLGAILYELLTGRAPFTGSTTAAILTAVSREQPVRPRTVRPAIDLDLETICLKCLQKEPAARYGSVDALAHDLEAWLEGRPIEARPVSAPARAWRWARRYPGVAVSLGAVAAAVLALALVSTVAAIRIEQERNRAEAGEAEAREALQASLLEQARNSRVTRRPGQRVDSLKALEASVLAAPETVSQEAIDEAVAALALPELLEIESWNLGVERPRRVSFEPTMRFYVIESEDAPGLELRRIGTAEVVARAELAEPLSGRPLFSPDGRWLVTRTPDAVLRVWSVPELALVREVAGQAYTGGTGDLLGEDLAFSDDGRLLGMAPAEGGYTVQDTVSGEVVLRWEDPRVPRAAAFSPDGRWLSLGNFTAFEERFTILVLDLSTGEEGAALAGFGSGQGVAWRPGSSDLAVAGSNRLDVRTRDEGHQLRRFEIADGPAHAMWWSPDGGSVWAWSDRGRFRGWDLLSGALAVQWYERTPTGTRFALSADRRLLATAGDQWRGVVWEWSPSPVRRTLRPPTSGSVFQVVPAPGTLEFSPDERFMLIAGLDRLAVLDIASGLPVLDLEPTGASEWTTARWGRSSNEIWWSRAGSGLWRLRFDSIESVPWPQPEETLVDPTPGLLVSDVDVRSGRLALAGYYTDQFRLFDSLFPENSYTWEAYGAFEMVFAPDGESVLTVRLDDRPEAEPAIAWIDLATSEQRPVPVHAPGGTIRWAPEADRIIAVTGAADVQLWEPGHAQPRARLPEEFAHSMGTYAIADDGRWVAAWTGSVLALLDGRTGRLLARLTEPGELYGEIRELRFSPSGRHLAAVRRNGTVSLWDIETLWRELRSRGLVR